MPIEFEEYKASKKAVPVGNSPLAKLVEEKPNSIITLLVSWKIAKNEDYAKLILLIVSIAVFSIAIYFGTKTYQAFNPKNLDTAPIDLNQIDSTTGQ